jgi:Acyl-CoA oxidase.
MLPDVELYFQVHARVFIVETFVSSMGGLNASLALKTVMTQLSDLYAIYNLLQNAGDFLIVSLVLIWQN